MKFILSKQPNGLYTVNIQDADVTFENAPPPVEVPQPDPYLWSMGSTWSTLPIGSSAREPEGMTEAFSSTIIATAPDGTVCARMGIDAGKTGFGQWGGIISHKENAIAGQVLDMTIATYFPGDFDLKAMPRLKFLRMHTMSDASPNEGYLDLYILPNGQFCHDNETTGFSSIVNGGDPFGLTIERETWEIYRVFVYLNSDPTKGFYKVYQNGKLIYERMGATLSTNSSYSDRTHIFTYWNGGAPKSQFMYVRDFSLLARLAR